MPGTVLGAVGTAVLQVLSVFGPRTLMPMGKARQGLGDPWVLGVGSRTREELGARCGCQRSENRLGLELAVETRVCFPQLSPPNALFSALFV